MASSSSSTLKWKYDVFLSFRGKDTRDNFTSHLYDALCRNKIKTFIDDKLKRGEEITPALLRTIEESRISVVIFSKNYASSPWCVDELVKIIECKEAYGQIVLPYHVDPSDVDEQTGSFGNAFTELENKFKGKMNKVPRWRAELTNAANISGSDSRVIRPESKLVNEIVQRILEELTCKSSRDLKGLVGIDSQIEQIKALLCVESPDILIIGIWGMGGIGKTTIAEAVFNNISNQYEGCCYLANVRQQSKEYGGLVRLRQEFLSRILKKENLHIETPRFVPTFIKVRLQHTKILAVLDDVDDICQLEDLIQEHESFGPGSRIIVTSRDKQAFEKVVNKEYEIKGLSNHEALELFSLNAFKTNQPSKGYMDLSICAINYAKGHPLALKFLGSSLFGKRKEIWESALDEFERIPEPKVHNVLRIGFDTLHDKVKSVFLDIACFFKGLQVDFVKGILDRPGFSTEIIFPILIGKCLITISNNKLDMHDLLQEMAIEFVRQENLGKRSRFWSPEDVYELLTQNLGTELVEGISTDISKIKEMKLRSQAFERMYNLRLLKFYDSGIGNICKVHLPHGLKSLSNKLRYLHWDGYPSRSLPSNFEPENLVILNLSSSNIEQLWKGDENLVNLKEVILSNCKHLTAIPDLSKARNLETLNLQFCTNLKTFPLSIQYLEKLIDLDLRHCKSLMSLPSRFNSRSLKTLNLSGCSNLKKYPEIMGNLTYLNFNETAIEKIPQSVGHLTGLVALNLKDCKQLGNLPDGICLLKCLVILNLSGCSNISKFPNISVGIRHLYLSGTAIEELPSSIGLLRSLSSLDLKNCRRLKNFPNVLFRSLEKLNLSGCSCVTKFPKVSWNIKELYLDGTAIREIPSSIKYCPELVELHMQNCERFEILPRSIFKLKSLWKLNLSGCTQFRRFPEIRKPMESLRYLFLDRTGITELPSSIGNLKGLSCLELGNCDSLDSFNVLYTDMDLKYMRKLNLDGCKMTRLPGNIGCLASLEVLDLSGNHFEMVPRSITELHELQYLGLRDCKNIKSLPNLPPHLAQLDADNCRSLEVISILSAAEGNIFEFLFTKCFKLDEFACSNIMQYAISKIMLYTTKLHSQMSFVPVGSSSFCLPACTIPKWFGHQTRGSLLTIQLPSNCTKSEFLGFTLCVVVAFRLPLDGSGFQVKCRYLFKNKCGDSHNLHCYFGGWHGWRNIRSRHLFFGYDPYVGTSEDDWLGKYSEVSIEFYPEDMNYNPLHCCEVIDCGAHLLYSQDQYENYCDCIHSWIDGSEMDLVRWYNWAKPNGSQGFHPTPSVRFSFRGQEIPVRFRNQCIGSSITICLPQDSHNSKPLGFALCFVIFSCGYCSNFSVRCTYEDLCCYLDWHGVSTYGSSESVFFWYNYCWSLMAFGGKDEASFQFCVVDEDKRPLSCCFVEKCGFHLLLDQDKKMYDPNEIRHGASFPYEEMVGELEGEALWKRYPVPDDTAMIDEVEPR